MLGLRPPGLEFLILGDGEQCHLIHLSILERFSWHSLAYICAQRWSKTTFIHLYLIIPTNLVCFSQSIQVDLVLQQSWLDRRLSSLTELPTPPPSTVPTKDPLVSGADRTQGRLYTDRLEEGAWHCLWTPDTYISNARSVVAPDTPHPQRLVRLRYGGNVMYSTRYV